jgi:hypothetical protein
MSCAKPSFFSSGDQPQSRVGLSLGQMQEDLTMAGGASAVSACLSRWYRRYQEPQVGVAIIGLLFPPVHAGVQLDMARQAHIEWVAADLI